MNFELLVLLRQQIVTLIVNSFVDVNFIKAFRRFRRNIVNIIFWGYFSRISTELNWLMNKENKFVSLFFIRFLALSFQKALNKLEKIQ